MKKQRKMDPTQLSNMIPPTSKNKRLKSAGSKADDVWNDLANDNTEPRIHQPEYIWTNQDITIFVAPEPEIPTIMILEQPEHCYRFRYGSEAGVVSLLQGVNSSKRVKTFPKIKLMNFVKKNYNKLDIFVSCVTHDDPHPYVHPYLVKNNKRKKGTNCSHGVCHVTLVNDDDTVEFVDIGIQRVKTDQTEKSLTDRKEMGIDPFNQGYEYKHSHYDKEALKLCFQAYLTDLRSNVVVLQPVTSNTISFTKSKGTSLHSVTPNEASSEDPVKLSIFADNLPRAGDIHVMFYTPEWSCLVLPEYQHHNCGLHVLNPKLDVQITEKTRVKIRLVRISNQAVTEPLDFFYFPSKKIYPFIQPPISGFETRANTNNENTKMFKSSPTSIVDLYNDQPVPNGKIDSHLTPSVNTPACNSLPLAQSSSANYSASDDSPRYELSAENIENVWNPCSSGFIWPVFEEENLFSDATTQSLLHPGFYMMDYI